MTQDPQGQAQQSPDQPRQLGLGDVTGLFSMGPEMVLQVLSAAIDAVGTGTEWTGDMVSRLGELQQQLAEKIAAIGGGDSTTA